MQVELYQALALVDGIDLLIYFNFQHESEKDIL